MYGAKCHLVRSKSSCETIARRCRHECESCGSFINPQLVPQWNSQEYVVALEISCIVAFLLLVTWYPLRPTWIACYNAARSWPKEARLANSWRIGGRNNCQWVIESIYHLDVGIHIWTFSKAMKPCRKNDLFIKLLSYVRYSFPQYTSWWANQNRD